LRYASKKKLKSVKTVIKEHCEGKTEKLQDYNYKKSKKNSSRVERKNAEKLNPITLVKSTKV
jgi:hypothetical protein